MLGDLVQRDYEPATLVAGDGAFRVVLTLVQMDLQPVEPHNSRAAKLFVIAGDLESREEIAEYPRRLGEVLQRGDWVSVVRTDRVELEPLVDARLAETVLALADLDGVLQDLATDAAH